MFLKKYIYINIVIADHSLISKSTDSNKINLGLVFAKTHMSLWHQECIRSKVFQFSRSC